MFDLREGEELTFTQSKPGCCVCVFQFQDGSFCRFTISELNIRSITLVSTINAWIDYLRTSGS